MNLPPMLSISPKKALIAIGVLISIVVNYDEFFAEDSAPAAPIATGEVAAQPSDAQPPPIARSPLERLKDSAEIGNVKDQLALAVKYSTADGVARIRPKLLAGI